MAIKTYSNTKKISGPKTGAPVVMQAKPGKYGSKMSPKIPGTKLKSASASAKTHRPGR